MEPCWRFHLWIDHSGHRYLDQIPCNDIFEWFRFAREDLPRLARALKIPDIIRLENGSQYDAMERLCLLMRRRAYPNRFTDIRCIFGRSKPELPMIFTYMIEFVDHSFGYLLISLDFCWRKLPNLQKFAHAIRRKGSPLSDIWGFIDDIWGFIDGNFSASLQTGCGSANSLQCALSTKLADSGLLNLLKNKMNELGRIFRIYGNPAYAVWLYWGIFLRRPQWVHCRANGFQRSDVRSPNSCWMGSWRDNSAVRVLGLSQEFEGRSPACGDILHSGNVIAELQCLPRPRRQGCRFFQSVSSISRNLPQQYHKLVVRYLQSFCLLR